MGSRPDATRVKEFFDEVASDWDSMRLAWYDERVIEALWSKVHAERSTTLLDLGTGTGFVAASLAPRVGRIVAVDSSPAMLDTARHNLRELGIRNVELREADVTNLPLATASVGAAVANMVLHHLEEPARVLSEMARVTKPGGWVAVADAVEHDYEWMRTEQADVWLGFSGTQVEAFFRTAGLRNFGYATLGFQ
jgi:ubiquinone/menaquinone biosynthesis C-methylase UbiE